MDADAERAYFSAMLTAKSALLAVASLFTANALATPIPAIPKPSHEVDKDKRKADDDARVRAEAVAEGPRRVMEGKKALAQVAHAMSDGVSATAPITPVLRAMELLVLSYDITHDTANEDRRNTLAMIADKLRDQVGETKASNVDALAAWAALATGLGALDATYVSQATITQAELARLAKLKG